MTGRTSNPPALDTAGRVEMTVSCRDADFIPKVADAGTIRRENGERVQIMHNGLRVIAGGYYGGWMSRIIQRLKGHHEPQEEAVFHRVLELMPPGATMLELGAFWSYYALWFLKDHPDRRAFAIEPDPANAEIGRRNAQINGLALDITPGFIGPEPGRYEFATERSGVLELDAIHVERFMHDRGIARFDLILCDAQGAEIHLLRQCRALARAGRIGHMLISTHHGSISGDPLTHQKCLDLVEEIGGRVAVEHDVHESFSGDGLILACFDPLPANWQPPALSRNRYSTSLFRNPLHDLARDKTADRDILVQLVRGMLGREPGEDEIARLLARTVDGGLKAAIENVARSPEARARNRIAKPVDTAAARTCAAEIGRPLLIVDVGAQRLADQGHAYQAIADAGIDHRVIGFEPIEERREDRDRHEGGTGLTLLPYFIGDGSEAKFHLNNFDATSSLFPLNRGLIQRLHGLDGLHTTSVETIKTTRLDQALRDICEVDFLKLDIQGGELDALRGAAAVLARTAVVHCEVEFAEIYSGQPLFSEIELHMRERGFGLIDIVNQHRSGYVEPPKGPQSADRLVWGEAVFFRALDGEPPLGVRRVQALIAEVVYRRPGLARYLRRQDARQSGA